MSVQRAQFEIPSTEFVDWIAYLDDEEENVFHREDYYLANIAAEIRRSYVVAPEKVDVESFLVKLVRKIKPKKKKPKVSIEERTKRSKSFWAALVKMPKSKKKKGMRK